MYHFRSLTATAIVSATLIATTAAVAQSSSSAAGQLLQKHAQLEGKLAQNPYGRPLVIESAEADQRVSGHAYSVVDFPFSVLSQQLKKPGNWCEIMILHINTKYCRAQGSGVDERLRVSVGKKTPQSLADASTLEFTFKLADASSTFFDAKLAAKDGPIGTSDYRIDLQAVPLPGGKTFLHLQYAYSYGFTGKLAMDVYLATAGRSKVGFTALGSAPNEARTGETKYIGGMRGTVERNTMSSLLPN